MSADIHVFPKAPPTKYGIAHPISAVAVAIKELNDNADPFTCIAGAMIMTDRLSSLGYEVVRRLDLPVTPLNEG